MEAKEDIYDYDLELIESNQNQSKLNVKLPVELAELLKSDHTYSLEINGLPYQLNRSNLKPGGRQMSIPKAICRKLEKGAGDHVNLKVAKRQNKAEVNIPDSLQNLLIENVKAKEVFQQLSYANQRDYAIWIQNAERDETRKRRLERTMEYLLRQAN